MRYCLALLSLLCWTVSAPLSAQAHADTDADTTFVTLARGTDLVIGSILHTDVHWGRTTATDGFRVRRARLRLNATAYRVRFFVQTDFTKSSVLLDARARFPVTEQLEITAGVFKTPFSPEFLGSAAALSFLDRSRVVGALAPTRDAGLSVRADLIPGRLQLQGGIFNGNDGGFGPNDNDHFLYVGRLSGRLPVAEGTARFSASLGYSDDDAVDLGPVADSFAGERWLIDGQAGITHGRWLLEGELIAAQLTADDGRTIDPYGFYVTGGASIAERHQLLLRFDTLDPDRPTLNPADELTFGYNFFWTDVIKLQANYTTPTDDIADGYVGMRLQLAFK